MDDADDEQPLFVGKFGDHYVVLNLKEAVAREPM